LLPVKDNGAPDVVGSYICLPPPSVPAYSIRFSIFGTSSICNKGSLWVNIPREGEPFDRANYTEYKYVQIHSFRFVLNCQAVARLHEEYHH
jgi:glycogen debranching enzyme